MLDIGKLIPPIEINCDISGFSSMLDIGKLILKTLSKDTKYMF